MHKGIRLLGLWMLFGGGLCAVGLEIGKSLDRYSQHPRVGKVFLLTARQEAGRAMQSARQEEVRWAFEEKQLFQRAIFHTNLEGEEGVWVSGRKLALFLKIDVGKHETGNQVPADEKKVTLVRQRDIFTGQTWEIPMPAHFFSVWSGGSHSVAPSLNGKWMVITDRLMDMRETSVWTRDGKRVADFPGCSTPPIFWRMDGRHFLHLLYRDDDQTVTGAEMVDAEEVHPRRHLEMVPACPLTGYNEWAWREGRLLVAHFFRSEGKPQVWQGTLDEYHLTKQETQLVRVRTFPIKLPLSVVVLGTVAIAPDCKSLAWAVRHSDYIDTLGVSALDGSHHHELGHIRDRKHFDSVSLQNLQWSPDAKHLSFQYHNDLYVLPVE